MCVKILGNQWLTLQDCNNLTAGTLWEFFAGIDKALQGVGIELDDQNKKTGSVKFWWGIRQCGNKSGVARLIQDRSGKHVILLHCVTHNLELAIGDAIKITPFQKAYDETVKAIFKFFYYSSKKRRELPEITKYLEENAA